MQECPPTPLSWGAPCPGGPGGPAGSGRAAGGGGGRTRRDQNLSKETSSQPRIAMREGGGRSPPQTGAGCSCSSVSASGHPTRPERERPRRGRHDETRDDARGIVVGLGAPVNGGGGYNPPPIHAPPHSRERPRFSPFLSPPARTRPEPGRGGPGGVPSRGGSPGVRNPASPSRVPSRVARRRGAQRDKQQEVFLGGANPCGAGLRHLQARLSSPRRQGARPGAGRARTTGGAVGTALRRTRAPRRAPE